MIRINKFIALLGIFSAAFFTTVVAANSTQTSTKYRPYFFVEAGNNFTANAYGSSNTFIQMSDTPAGNGNSEQDNTKMANAVQFAFGAGIQLPTFFNADWVSGNAVEFSLGYFKNTVNGSRLETSDTTVAPPFTLPTAITNYNYTVSNVLFLVNYVLDFKPIFSKVTPFIAVGAGLNHAVTDAGSNPQTSSSIDGQTQLIDSVNTTNQTQTQFAYDFSLGVRIAMTQKLQASLGYRYINAGNIGLRQLTGINHDTDQSFLLTVPTNNNSFHEAYLRLTYQL